jgi:aerobic-type carbon monoxide dehydrogenase small subunit (CoxS/CutS family)
LRKTRLKNEPRSIFCGIGICWDCVVTVNGVTNQRSCLIEVVEGMVVSS